MPRYPAACQIGTPRCISQVAAVCRRVCGVTSSPQSGQGDRVLEPGLDRFNWGAVPFYEMRRDDAAADPAPHVGEQPRRYRRRRLPLVGCTPADGQTVVDALVKIDKRMTMIAVRRGRSDRTGPGSSVEADQDEPRQVSKRPLVGFNRLSFLRDRDARSVVRDIASKPRSVWRPRRG